MGLPVDRWQWEQLIMSKHGPRSTSVRLALVAIAACASNSQTQAWPSQELVAERAGLSPRQVKRLLQDAESSGWVHRSMAHKPGQRWRYTVYDFTVPSELFEAIPAHPWEQDPKLRRGATGDTQSGIGVTSMTPGQPRESSRGVDEGTNGADKVTSTVDEVTKAPSDKVTNGVDEVTQLWPMKSPSEVSSQVSKQVSTHGAPSRTVRVKRRPEIDEHDPEVKKRREEARALTLRLAGSKST